MGKKRVHSLYWLKLLLLKFNVSFLTKLYFGVLHGKKKSIDSTEDYTKKIGCVRHVCYIIICLVKYQENVEKVFYNYAGGMIFLLA